ncbi:MAG: insulinase family protein, partial [Candidatus Heimdallarchaeota archaeon]|nr:insulinase family protein [Candidatus Heimdallarchaeota archaeon]
MSNFEVKTLDNMVPVLLVFYEDGTTFTIGISFNVGGRNEWKRKASYDGISHFLEHQFFKGSPQANLTPAEVNRALDGLAGVTNAYTTEDHTAYFVKCLNDPETIDNAIELWDKLLILGEINQTEFDKESFVVRQEFRRMEDNPPFLLNVRMNEKLFEGTSLEMTVIGDEESLESVTLEQMESYRDEHYGLENAALMVLGNFDKDRIFNMLNATFGSRKVRSGKPTYEKVDYQVPKVSNFNFLKINKPTPLIYYGFTVMTPGALSDDKYGLQILMAYLTLGRSAQVQEKLVRTGLCAFAFAFTSIFEDIGSLTIIAGVQGSMHEKAHDATFLMLHDTLTMDVSDALLTKIVDRMEFSARSNQEEPLSIMYSQAASLWRSGKFVSMEERFENLRNVSVDKFKEVRQKVLGQLNGV